jgi:O-antigen ligase
MTGRGLATVTDKLYIENLYIVFLAEMGIIGFVLIGICAVFSIRFFVRHLSTGQGIRSALVGLSSIFVLAVTGFFSLSLWGIRSMELFSIIMSILAAHLYDEFIDEGISTT